jgi:plastocyanin
MLASPIPILIGGCALVGRRAPVTHVIEIRAMRFEPAELRAAVGDTVRWRNADFVPHTVTAGDGAFDSGNLPADSSWALVIERDGTFDYSCLYHPTMAGQLVAES